MSSNQERADRVMDEAGRLLTAGHTVAAAQRYRDAIALHPPYARHELVVADTLRAEGQLEEAVVSYRNVVEAIPDQHEAWRCLVEVLEELGRPLEARRAALEGRVRPRPTTGDHISGYWDAGSIDERVPIVGRIVRDPDPRVPELLRHFLGLSGRDTDAMNRDQDYWAVLASILVRFGKADDEYWYSDGPAPDRDLIRSDVADLLRGPDEPKTKRSWWRRLKARLGR